MKLRLWILFGAVLLLGKGYLGLNIEMCFNGWRSVTEYTNVSLTCGGCSALIDWFVYDQKDQRKTYIGNCTKTKCTLQNMFGFRLNVIPKIKNFDSVLDIISISRGDTLVLSCQCYYYSSYNREYVSYGSDLCRLQIQVPVSIVSNSCSVYLSQWKVFGVCTIQWLYNPVCKWSLIQKNETRELSTAQGPTVYVPQDSSYRRENCTFEVNMPTDEGNYTFSISVSLHPADQFSKIFLVEQPGRPEHNCPEIVLEGSNLNCTCYASKIGNPPAQIMWDKEKLVVENVQRKSSGTNVTCYLLWGEINRTTLYTIRVAHGPSGIYIRSSTDDTSGESEKTILVCTAIDVYPSAVFRWNISCETETHNVNTSTCTLSTARLGGELTVECTAINQIFENVSSSDSHFHNFTRIGQIQSGNKEAHSNGKASNVQGGIIGGVVGAVIIIAVIVTVIVVYIIKRRKKEFNSERFTSRLWPCAIKFFRKKTPLSTPYATVHKPKSETPLKCLAAPSGDLYTRATNTISLDVSGDYVTVSDTVENTDVGMNRDCTFMANQFRHETTELTEAVKLTMNPKPTAARTKNIQDTAGSVYMNVTEVPTDSGLGVYHIVPWRTMSAVGETDKMNDPTKAVSDDEYNVLSFEEDRTGQEDQAATYHHLEHE